MTKYRMYGLVNYQLANTVHAGIQFGHAVVEYANKYFDTDEYQQWAKNDKTFIILNGGTTNDNRTSEWFGTLNQHLDTLLELGVKLATFNEPDLGNQLTAIVFLVSDKVWDKEKYPDANINKFAMLVQGSEDMNTNIINEWTELLGETNVKLREFLPHFTLI